MADAGDSARLEVSYEYARELPQLLEHLNVSLLVSTYQAGRLAVVGSRQGKTTLAFSHFERAMGVAVAPGRIAVGAQRQVFVLRPEHKLAAHVEPRGTHDACWLTRGSLITSDVHGHEMAWGRDGLWLANTRFSCLCTVDEAFSFVPRWRPPFITELAAEDRCHLNGLAMQDGRPRFVTAHGETNEAAGWRAAKADGGCVIDVSSGQTIVRGLSMPHSPRWHNDRLWALDSGTGRVVHLLPQSGHVETVAALPGYTRGLALHGQYAFVGLSRIRETSVFGDIPLAENRAALQCGVAVVDLLQGRTVAWLRFHSGVEEVFAVALLPNCRNPVIVGPAPEADDQADIWVVPPEGAAPPATSGLLAEGECDGAFPDARTQNSASVDVARLAADAATLHAEGKLGEALQRLTAAVEAAPDRGDLLNSLGNLYQDLGNQQAAIDCYRRAVQLQPDFISARQNLGYLLLNFGAPEEALAHLEQAVRLSPTPMNRFLAATVLPVIYDSVDDVERWRQRFSSEIARLVAEGVQIDTTRTLVPTCFFLTYQGGNDREIAQNIGRIFRGVELVGKGAPQARGRRLRVGFLSAYFRNHTVGRLNLGRVRHLDRAQFEVTVIYTARQQDALAQSFAEAADHYVVVPRDVEAARRQIAALGLDVLVFAEVGMDALTYTLAFSRMAPVQCSTWGHPETSGSPTIDWFISNESMETPDADGHYTERLARLPNLGTYYERPRLAGEPRTREFFGLHPTRHIYVCPQTLFKFHPEFSAVLARILARDRDAELVLLEGRVPTWTQRLQRQLVQFMGNDIERVRFLPAQPQPDYWQLIAAADVMLDPFPFGGGNTSYEALAVGTPVVTWPGQFSRGRITLAQYHKMGYTECVAESPAQYVDLAVRLASDAEYRQSVHEAILARCGGLFEDMAEVRAFEAFLHSAAGNSI